MYSVVYSVYYVENRGQYIYCRYMGSVDVLQTETLAAAVFPLFFNEASCQPETLQQLNAESLET